MQGREMVSEAAFVLQSEVFTFQLTTYDHFLKENYDV